MEKKNIFLLNNETDKLQMINKVIHRVNNQINAFFENNQTLENVLNIKGTWGTGKTTVVTHLEENFNQRFNNKNVKFYTINLWEYETVLNPYDNLIKDILNKIIKPNDLNLEEPEKSKNKIIAKWYANLSWQIPLISLLGIKATVGTNIKENEEKSLNELNNEAIREIKKYIKQENLKIVFIFDEIDRCTLKNQIKFLSYIKNIFHKITNIFFIVSCNNQYIDSNLSLSNDDSEPYTCKLFNKIIDLNLIIPSYRGVFTNNQFIDKFIKEIYNNKKITLSPREINTWLEKTNIIFLNFKKENDKSFKAWNKEIFIYQGIEEEIKFIIFFCFYIKNKEKDYYFEIIDNDKDNFMTSNSFNLLLNFLNKKNKKYNQLTQAKLMEFINANKWDERRTNDIINVFVGWKDLFRNKYSFHIFSLLPFILPIINDENINNFFEQKITKDHYLSELNTKQHYSESYFDSDHVNILFKYEKEWLPEFLKLFLDILWENSAIKNEPNLSNISENIIEPVMHYFNYKNIFNIIENTIFY